ncbi:MAG: hypothetical protein M3018_14850, partial [Actinomycetota bacterium]|nr:hypothetical protein [Actinomycetota bacterium]
VKTWSIRDKIDGIGADPLNHRVIVTENEDGNTHLFTLTPSAPAAQRVVQYAYSPNPQDASAPVALRTGGGTDQVSVDSAGHILITGSHARRRTGTAVFKVVLSPPSSPSGTGRATLSPTFLDNATAANGNTGTGTVTLHLGDVDSGAIVPQSSPRFGGSYVIADQTAPELVFASNIFNGTGLTVLRTPFTLDDIRWATSDGGALYVVNNGGMVPGGSAIYKVTGPFKKNTVLASNDGVGDQVVTANLATGALTPFVRHLTQATGLVYLDPSGTQTELALNGGGGGTASKPTASRTSLSGLSSGKPQLSFTVTHGTNAPNVSSISVGVSGGLSFNKKAFVMRKNCAGKGSKKKRKTTTTIKGLSVSSAKVKSVKLGGGKLLITLKTAVRSVKVTIAGQLLVERKSVEYKVKKKKVKMGTVIIKIKDAKRTITTIILKLPVT